MTITEPITPVDIQYLLKKKGITQKALAAKCGCAEMSMSDVINFRMVSDRLMQAVAKEIGMAPETVFGWYYNGPKRRPRRHNTSNRS